MNNETEIMDEFASGNSVAVATNPYGVGATQQPSIQTNKVVLNDVNHIDKPTRFNFDKDVFTLEEILKYDFNEVPFLVEGLFPTGCISLIVGESDLGKSTFHTQLSLSIVSGQETFLGRKINAIHKRVLIVSTEEGINAIGNRLQKQATMINLDEEAEKRLIILTTSANISKRISQILKQTPVDLVIVDAFSDIFLSDMNISNKVRSFFNAYDEINKEFKCSMIFIHHIGKSREGFPLHKNQILGSVGIVDKAREVLMLSRDKKSSTDRQLTILKANYVSDEEKKQALILKFDVESRTFEKSDEIVLRNINKTPGELIYKEFLLEVKRRRDEGETYDQIGAAVGRDKSSISRAIQKHPEIFETNPEDDL